LIVLRTRILERCAQAPGNADYVRLSAQLPPMRVEVCSDEDAVALEIGPATARVATADRDTALTISGGAEGWEAVLSGRHALVRETNVYHGRLRVEGDPVLASWSMPALAALLRGSGET